MIRRFARASRSLGGALVLAALALPAASASAPDLEFSSQGMTDRGVPQVGGAPQGAGPRAPVGAPRHMGGPPRGPAGAPRHMGGPPRGPAVVPHVGGHRPQVGGQRPHIGETFRGPVVDFGPAWRGPQHRGHAFYRGRHHVRRGGVLLPLVGLGALGAIYVGSRYYTPYAYVDVPDAPTCAGSTEDGLCELRLTEVPLESGGAALQCVAYCPQ